MAVKTLADLVANSEIQANTPDTLSKVIDIEVPRGKFLYFADRPQILRPAVYEIQSHDLTAGEISAGEFDTETLTDQPAKPPARYIPTWPSVDGYTFRVFLAYSDPTYGDGAWTEATINAVDWANKQLTIDLPSTLPDHAGNDHSLQAGDTVKVRISYAASSGEILLARETPRSERQKSMKVAWQSSPYSLNVRDQFHRAGRWSFPTIVWAPEKCRITMYMNLPVALDIEPDYSVMLIQLDYVLDDLSRAEAKYLERYALMGRPPKYRTLYHAFLAQVSGIEPEAPVV